MKMRTRFVWGLVLGLSLMGLLGATYTKFSPGGALSGTWNSQTVAMNSGAFITGTLPAGNGGTGQTAATDDTTLVGNGTAFAAKAVPNCANDGTHGLVYDTSTNSFACATLSGAVSTSGTFTATFTTGFTTSPTQNFAWVKVGDIVVLRGTSTLSGTSNSTAVNTAAGDLPAAIRPSTTLQFAGFNGTDNGAATPACLRLAADGTITWNKQTAYATACNVAWTNTGSKAVSTGSNQSATITYSLVN